MRGDRGFSMVELLVVFILISLIAVMSFHSMRVYVERSDAERSLEDLSSLITELMLRARADGRPYLLRFSGNDVEVSADEPYPYGDGVWVEESPLFSRTLSSSFECPSCPLVISYPLKPSVICLRERGMYSLDKDCISMKGPSVRKGKLEGDCAFENCK
jgi:prepilin-type N-terminal cleavage/methylation domain-containing protein